MKSSIVCTARSRKADERRTDDSKRWHNKSNRCFLASDLICKVRSLRLWHEEYRLYTDGHGRAAQGRGIAGEIFVMRVAGGDGVSGGTGGVPDGLGLDAGRVLEAASPDGARGGAVGGHRTSHHPVVDLLIRYTGSRKRTSVKQIAQIGGVVGVPVRSDHASRPEIQIVTCDVGHLVCNAWIPAWFCIP